MWRRVVLAFFAVLAAQALSQVVCFVVMAYLMSTFLMWARPFQTQGKNLMEFFNEMSILVIAVIMMCLLGLIEGLEAKRKGGNLLLAVVMILTGINMIQVSVFFGFKLFERAKRYYLLH